MREEYVSPVGFAKEPSEERRRWIGRVLLIALVIFVAWLLLTGKTMDEYRATASTLELEGV